MIKPINWGRVFCWAQIALSFAAAAGYAARRDWKLACYWLLAALIVAVINLW